MRIGIVGLGYVGLPLAVAFCEAGHEVVGVDTDARTVEALARRQSHIEDVAVRAAGGDRRALPARPRATPTWRRPTRS